jgi:type I restriction enzyme M protein
MAKVDLALLEQRLWDAADELRANSGLTPAEYSLPVLGLVFLAFADHRFNEARGGTEQRGFRSPRGQQGRLSGPRSLVPVI